jgi:ankyrin repeat protein
MRIGYRDLVEFNNYFEVIPMSDKKSAEKSNPNINNDKDQKTVSVSRAVKQKSPQEKNWFQTWLLKGNDLYLENKDQFIKLGSCVFFLLAFMAVATMVSCTTAPVAPSQTEIEASVYKLYKTTPHTINTAGPNGRPPLYEAVKFNDIDAVRIFLRNEKINVYGKPSALIRASFNGNHEIVKLLIDKGAKVNQQNHNGETALMIAARKQYLDIVETLLGAGALPDLTDKKGSSALMKSVLLGNIPISNALIRAGADLNLANDFNRTALIYAVAKNHEEMALGIIQPGVDVNARDKMGKSAILYAAQNGNLNILKKLIQAGARVDLKDKDKSALEKAALNGHTEVVKSLIQAGN